MRIFHQNMQNFGGGSDERNTEFAPTFLSLGFTIGPVLAAGFTEILNANTSIEALPGLAQSLDPALTGFILIAVGNSASDRNTRREYIGIAYRPDDFVLEHAGNVLWSSMGQRWEVFDTSARHLPEDNVIPLPAGVQLTADQRGVAYIGGVERETRNHMLIGFMHNQYETGDRTGGFSALPTMAARMRETIGGEYIAATVHIGGDFNVAPRSLSKRPLALNPLAAQPVGAREEEEEYIDTTEHNPYDFWLTTDGTRRKKHCAVHRQTRGPSMSDHAGISFRYR